jgi:CRP/FNR family transcriptional regulator
MIITSGKARVFSRSVEGKETTLYHIEPGDICVLSTACMFSGQGFPAEAETESPVIARAMSPGEFTEWLNALPEFREFVFKGFSRRISSLVDLVQKVTSTPVGHRLINYLLAAQEKGQVKATHQKIANEISSAREVVSRQLKELENKGLLKLSRGSVSIISEDGLKKELSRFM